MNHGWQFYFKTYQNKFVERKLHTHATDINNEYTRYAGSK